MRLSSFVLAQQFKLKNFQWTFAGKESDEKSFWFPASFTFCNSAFSEVQRGPFSFFHITSQEINAKSWQPKGKGAGAWMISCAFQKVYQLLSPKTSAFWNAQGAFDLQLLPQQSAFSGFFQQTEALSSHEKASDISTASLRVGFFVFKYFFIF